MKNCIQGIYGIFNTLNGDAYIGSSIRVEQRWTGHRRLLRKGSHVNQHLQNAWNKYGECTFKFCIVEIVADKYTIYDREAYWINLFGIYNLQKIPGDHPLDISQQIRDKISDNTKGKKRSPECRKNISEARKGKLASEETKLKMSISQTGRKHSDSTKEKISTSQKGKIISNEAKRKLSEYRTGTKHTEETKINLSQRHKVLFNTPEMVAKLSAAHKGKKWTDKQREVYMVNPRVASEEEKKRTSERVTKYWIEYRIRKAQAKSQDENSESI